MSESTTDYVNVLLHGLFFMEFQTTNLVITSPNVDMHLYRSIINGLPADLPHDMDWVSQNPLRTGLDNSFSNHRQIPQFSKDRVGRLIGPYRFRLVLPAPDEIIPLRLGKLADFYPVAKSAVGADIKNYCSQSGNTDLAVVTCLQYERNAAGSGITTNYSFYAEHLDPTMDDVNNAYLQAQQLFENPGRFDLQLDTSHAPKCVLPVADPSDDITEQDEYSLLELKVGGPCPKEAASVANCIQFGLVP